MSVRTNNVYGKITISDKTIERFVYHVALESYGIVNFSPNGIADRVSYIVRPKKNTGVKVHSSGDRVFIDISVIVIYGVSIKAVVESLKEALRYKVEKFTGMVVDTINVFVRGVQK